MPGTTAPSVLLLALILSCFVPNATRSFVIVSDTNRTFPSLPALFGEPWEENVTKTARLQFLEERPLLCRQEEDVDYTATVPTSDGLPIALLVERGECTFWEKAAEALKYDGVQYVVIHDNLVDSSLLRMGSDDRFDGIAPLFIFRRSGLELRDILTSGTIRVDNETSDGNETYINVPPEGLLVELDGKPMFAPPPEPGLSFTGYLLAALMGFFVFLVFFACLLICAQVGLIAFRTDDRGRMFIVTGRRGSSLPIVGRIIPQGVLTVEQATALKEEKFQHDSITETTDTVEQIGGDGSNDSSKIGNSIHSQSGGKHGSGADVGCTDESTTSIQVDAPMTYATADTTNAHRTDESAKTPLPSPSSESVHSAPMPPATSADAGSAPGTGGVDHGENDDDEPEHTCAICIDGFENGDTVKVLPCGHRFHPDCVIPWLTERQSKCPLCKFDVLQHILANNDGTASHCSSDASLPNSRRRWRLWQICRNQGFDPVEQRSSSSSNSSERGLEMETMPSNDVEEGRVS